MLQSAQNGKQPPDGAPSRGGIIDLDVLAKIVRTEAITFATVLLSCVLLSIVYLHIAKPRYAVRMEITAASSSEQQHLGGLGAISSLAGINLGGEGSPQFKVFLGSLQSPVAADAVVSDQELLRAIFYREWADSDHQWREPPSHIRPALHWVGRILGWKFPAWAPPGVSRVFDYLNDQLKVIRDTKSGVVTLEIDSDKPEVAARILLTLNSAMNERLRQHDLEHATSDIDYLTKRLLEVNVVEYRSALVSNLAEQEKSRMQASAPLPYASDVLGKPMISSKPVSPKPLAVWFAGIIVGGLLGLWVASLKYNRR